MKVTYDQEVDILNIELSDAEIEESDEDSPASFSIMTATGMSLVLKSSTLRNVCRFLELSKLQW